MVAYLVIMLPTVSIGPFSISSYGLLLAAGFLFGVFLVWRLTRAWDLSEEKVLDLTLLTFLGGFIGARVYFILENFSFFGGDLFKWLLLYKYPGFSLWGAILGGVLTLKFFSKKFRLNFWQTLDFAAVGFLTGLIFLDLGCFFASCNIGTVSKLFFALPMVGVVGKRFPVQIFEAILLIFALIRIWKLALHFHIQGTIFAISLIYIGLIMLIMELFKQNHSEGVFLNVILIVLGTTIFYTITKREIASDIKASYLFLVSIRKRQVRKTLMVRMHKSWYNYKVSLVWKARGLSKILRKLNVYFSHKDSKYY